MKLEVLRGRLDSLVLAVLEDGPLHGYGIVTALRTRSDGALDLPSGTIYPALRRLERAGFVSSQWSVEGGRKRRTYSLTPRGRSELTNERNTWRMFTRVVDGVLGNG